MFSPSLLTALSALTIFGTNAYANAWQTYPPAEQHPVPVSTAYGYAGIGYAKTTVDDKSVTFFPPYRTEYTDIDYQSVMLQAGFQYSPYLAVEFRYWFSMSDGDYTTDSIDGTFEDFDGWGVYLKPQYPVADNFSVYALIGFSGVTIDGGPTWDLLYYDSDFSWGGGFTIDLAPNVSLFADYVRLFNRELDFFDYTQDTKVETINFGVTFKF